MADSNSGSPGQRRKSFVEMLNPKAFGTASSFTTGPSSAIPVPASPGVAGNRKSMSMALGLSSSAASQDSPYNAFARQRRASISTSTASGSPEFRNSFDNNAVIEEDDKIGAINSPPSPSFARRLSFGAQALRDAKQGGIPASVGSNAGRRPSSSLFTLNEDPDKRHADSVARTPGTAKTGGEGFNWSDAMRDRKRPSVAAPSPFAASHNRSKSMTASAPEPPKEMPKPPPAPAAIRSKKPDHLGERMLRGDFMMD